MILRGRGAGKTRAGAEWVRAQVEGARLLTKGRAKRVALVAETLDQARDVMIFGDSGIMDCSPLDGRPKWEATKKRLIWPNEATATIYSAHDPESLRGPQFDAAWVDELSKWRNAQATLDMLQFALRLGDDPRQCMTTTPRNVGVLKFLLNLDSTVTTHATTYANAAHLADSFLTKVRAPETWRAILQPLAAAHGFDAVEQNGAVQFIPRRGQVPTMIDSAEVVASDEA